MKKFILLVLAVAVVINVLSEKEINVSSAYAAHPYDRCMEAHQGMPQQDQCKYLKGAE